MFGTVFEIATWYFYPPRWPEACVRRRHGFQTASAPLTPLLITGLRWAEPSPHLKPCPLPTPFRYSDFISILFLMQRISPFSVMLCVLLRCQLLSALKCKLSERKDSLVTLLWAFPGLRAAGDTCREPYTTQRQAAGQLEVMQKKKIGCKDRFN